MPNRILRDWTDSRKVEQLTAEGERLFSRLIMRADDFGRYHTDVRLIRAGCFPLIRDLRDADISRWRAECAKAGLIAVYEVNGCEYLAIVNFRQRTRQERSKFPPPVGEKDDWLPDDNPLTDDCPSIDSQLHTEAKTKAHAKTKALIGLPPDLDTPALAAAWNDFVEHRKQLRKPLTDKAAEQKFKDFREWGATRAVAAIRHSIGSGWTGIFEPKNGSLSPGESAEARAKRVAQGMKS